MTIYVVHGNGWLVGASPTRDGAENLMVRQIERICKTTHEAEILNDRCYDMKLTMFTINEEPKMLSPFDLKELKLAFKGVAVVLIEIAGSKEKYYIHSTEMVG